jgi:excisionase family DNA binding protein
MSEIEHISEILPRVLEKLDLIYSHVLSTDKPFLSLDEAAEYTQIPKASLYTYCSRGTVPFFKRGRRTFFKKSELDQWILENKVKSDCELSMEAATRMVLDR